MKFYFAFGVMILSIILVSCGTTRITCDDPKAEIYVDYQYEGTGTAEIKSIGPPNTAVVMAQRGGQVIGETTMSRKFTVGTFAWGLFTYYTGWYWGWYYPDHVVIPLNKHFTPSGDYVSPWDHREDSKWTKPMNWGGK